MIVHNVVLVSSLWCAAISLPSRADVEQPRQVSGTVLLAGTRYVVPGDGGRVVFTAPAIPGFYTWSQLLPAATTNQRPGQNVLVVRWTPTGVICQELRETNDASTALQGCVNRTPTDTALDIPPGRYVLERQVRIERPIVIRTAGLRPDDVACDGVRVPCAEFVAAPGFEDAFGMLISTAPNRGLTLDHLRIDGSKTERAGSKAAAQCAAGLNQYGFNVDINNCSDCRVTNSVFKNALCGTGLRVWNVSVVNSQFIGNGVHAEGIFADGLTVGRCDDSYIVNNRFADNTDVDLIFGSGIRCHGQDNVITHSADPLQGSFVAMMLFTWYTAGHYFGSDFSFNTIDCADRCGIGLYLGADQAFGPYATFIEGGAVHDNVIRGAHQGVAVDTARDVVFYNNPVSGTSSSTPSFCGELPTTAYSQSPESRLDRSRDPIAQPWAVRQWDFCAPNWYRRYAPMQTLSGDFNGDGVADTLDMFPNDRLTWNVSEGARAWLTGWGAGNRYVVADVDGNGRKDIVLYLDDGQRWYVALSRDGAFVPVLDALTGVELPGDSCSVVSSGRDVVVIEREDGNRCARYDDPSGRFLVQGCGLRCEPLDPTSPPSTTSPLLYGDFNGDTVRDKLAIDPVGAVWSVTTGRREWMQGVKAGRQNLVGDFDGDGRDDVLIVRHNYVQSWDLALSAGAWFTPLQDVLQGVRFVESVCIANIDADAADEAILRRPFGNRCADFQLESRVFSLRHCDASC